MPSRAGQVRRCGAQAIATGRGRVGRLPWLAALLVLVQPLPASAQEVRASFVQAFSGVREVDLPRGIGFGVRGFAPMGIGGGIEFDRYRSAPSFLSSTCPPEVPSTECELETVTMDTEMEILTFLVLFDFGSGESWGLRVGLGRSAGAIRGRGTGETTGREVEPPPADSGKGNFGWSRGADGSVFLIEVLRSLPAPGPLPVDLHMTYRHHHTEMSGCVTGEVSPFCGSHSMNEIQLGLRVGLWPGR